ncbi:hypothetical protein ABPG72_020005 [Tetrahymena utriculariae]
MKQNILLRNSQVMKANEGNIIHAKMEIQSQKKYMRRMQRKKNIQKYNEKKNIDIRRIYKFENQISKDDILQEISRLKHQNYEDESDSGISSDFTIKNLKQKQDFSDISEESNDNKIANKLNDINLDYFQQIKQINSDLQDIRQKENDLIEKRNQLEQEHELKKQNFQYIMKIEQDKLKNMVDEVNYFTSIIQSHQKPQLD